MELDTTADDGPTEAEVAADRELATQVVIASLTGVASIASVYAGAVAAAFAPVALAFALPAVRRMGQRRIENATEALMYGADAACVSVAEFIDRAATNERRHELFASMKSCYSSGQLTTSTKCMSGCLVASRVAGGRPRPTSLGLILGFSMDSSLYSAGCNQLG